LSKKFVKKIVWVVFVDFSHKWVVSEIEQDLSGRLIVRWMGRSSFEMKDPEYPEEGS
jgi:hypothetical protein